VAQIMYTHVNKYKINKNKRKGKKRYSHYYYLPAESISPSTWMSEVMFHLE
jgi:hypothetical protein